MSIIAARAAAAEGRWLAQAANSSVIWVIVQSAIAQQGARNDLDLSADVEHARNINFWKEFNSLHFSEEAQHISRPSIQTLI
jgi:hypothetical protein